MTWIWNRVRRPVNPPPNPPPSPRANLRRKLRPPRRRIRCCRTSPSEIDLSNLKVPVAQKPSKAESLRVEEFKAEKYEARLPAKTRDGYVFPSVDLLDKSGDGLPASAKTMRSACPRL